MAAWLTILVVLVGAHLVDRVDGVAHRPVKVRFLAGGQAVGRVRVEARNELGPRLGEHDPAAKKKICPMNSKIFGKFFELFIL